MALSTTLMRIGFKSQFEVACVRQYDIVRVIFTLFEVGYQNQIVLLYHIV